MTVAALTVDPAIVPPDSDPIVPPMLAAVAMVDPLIVEALILLNVETPVAVMFALVVIAPVIVFAAVFRSYRASAPYTFKSASPFAESVASVGETSSSSVTRPDVSKSDGYPLLLGRIVNLRAVLL